MSATKVCAKCGGEKPATKEYFASGGKTALHSYCRDCYREWRRAWTADNRDRVRATQKKWVAANHEKMKAKRIRRGLRNRGVTEADFKRMLAAQAGVCGICGGDRTRTGATRLSVDHDHKTGVVRGLLCSSCNFGIGYFRDDPKLLATAILYLLAGDGLNRVAGKGLSPLDAWTDSETERAA